MKAIHDNITNDDDKWGWSGPLVAVLGFGFFPSRVRQELDPMTTATLYF